jgi:hypothetical protein
MLTAHLHLPLLFAVSFLSPSPSFGQLNVITSVGFAAAYNDLVRAFTGAARRRTRSALCRRDRALLQCRVGSAGGPYRNR